MIASKIVSFCIFSLLKYDRIFGKNLEHNTYAMEWNKVLDPALHGRGVSARFGPKNLC